MGMLCPDSCTCQDISYVALRSLLEKPRWIIVSIFFHSRANTNQCYETLISLFVLDGGRAHQPEWQYGTGNGLPNRLGPQPAQRGSRLSGKCVLSTTVQLVRKILERHIWKVCIIALRSKKHPGRPTSILWSPCFYKCSVLRDSLHQCFSGGGGGGGRHFCLPGDMEPSLVTFLVLMTGMWVLLVASDE